MAALSADRDTPRKYLERRVVLPMAASTKIYAGAIVSVNSSGYAIPAADTASTRVIGRACSQVDNSSGSNGDLKIEVDKGVFGLINGTTPVTIASLGTSVYVQDDNAVTTVGAATNDIVMGTLDEIDADGICWVAIL